VTAVWPGARDWRQLLPWASPQCFRCGSGRAGDPIASPGEGERGRHTGPTEGGLRHSPRRPFPSERIRTYDRPVRHAGIAVPDQDVLGLALRLRAAGFAETAERLENAYDLETKILALTIDDRERIIRALDDPPAGLVELRGVLLQEHEWRVREGLV
jgi:hypothetical protein